jgi:HK97 family phage prohead protease
MGNPEPELQPESEFVPFEDGSPVSRSILPGPGFKEDSEPGRLGTLFGQLAPYDEWSKEIDSPNEAPFPFMERLSRGAFSKSMNDRRASLRVIFQHGEDPQIGLKPLGTIERLEEGRRSVEYEVSLFDTDYNRELLPALKSGQFGTSWTFHPIRDKFTVERRPQRSNFNPQGVPQITHHEVKLIEFGPVTFPAYAGATAGVRSMTDYFLFRRLARDPEQLKQFLTTVASAPTIPAEVALSNERAEGEPHSGAESRNVPLVPVRKRFQTPASWYVWCESALK